MKNKRRKYIILISIMVLAISIIFFVYKNNKIYEEKKDSNKEMFAIMIEKSEGRYVEYRSSNWPKKGYIFAEAKCVDRDKNNLGNLVTYDVRTNTAIMKSTTTSFCTLYFKIDNIAPVTGSIYIGSTPEQVYTNNVNEEMHIKVDDDDVIEYCLINEKNSSMCEWKELPELSANKEFIVTDFDLGSDGEKTVYLYLKDGAENTSDVVEDSIILDTVAPNCKLWNESTIWINSNRTITYGCEDDRSGCNVEKIGNQTFEITTRKGTIKNYTIQDNAGNTNNCNGVSANVYVDKTAPTCSIGGNPSSWQNTNATLTQNGTDSGEGTVYYSWDNKNGYSVTKSNKTVSANGTYTLYVKDGIGNEANCTASVTKIDKTAPTCTLKAAASGISFNTTDGTGSSIANSGINKSTTASYTNKTATLSAATFYGHVKDDAGNTGRCSISVSALVQTNSGTCIGTPSNYCDSNQNHFPGGGDGCYEACYEKEKNKSCGSDCPYLHGGYCHKYLGDGSYDKKCEKGNLENGKCILTNQTSCPSGFEMETTSGCDSGYTRINNTNWCYK